jgi:hypothetical protein
LREAEQVIGEALRANKTAIKEWAKLAGPGQTKAFTLDVGRIIGQGIVRGSSQMQPMSKVVVVLLQGRFAEPDLLRADVVSEAFLGDY